MGKILTGIVCYFLVLMASAQTVNDFSASENYLVKLERSEKIRNLINEILEIAVILPTGSVIEISKKVTPVNYQYRDTDGVIKWSSNGFYPEIKIVSAPNITSEKIAQINSLAGGLFVTSTILNLSSSLEIKPIVPVAPRPDYLKVFNESGKIKKGQSAYFKTRFKDRLNFYIDLETLPDLERDKSLKVFAELQRFGNRLSATPSDLIYTTESKAIAFSKLFELKGEVQTIGAHTIATIGTAARHGFGNVPCAEFMSEVVRQAYKRAGYSHFEDFNVEKGNLLFWNTTAAVVNLANNLVKGGWIPWDATIYSPPTGAILFHYRANTPGHTYMSGGDNGRIIVDNGSPRGRDLRGTSLNIIEMMFQTTLFMLPPGIIPPKWNNKEKEY